MQILRNKELDFAIAELRHCGQLAQEGIRCTKQPLLSRLL